MEKLRTYMRSRRIRQLQFAAHIGIRQGYLSDIINGKASPSLMVAARIETATGGEVRCIDLVDPALFSDIERIK